MKTTDVMKALEKLGSAQTKKTYLRHGCPEPFFGVKIADMKALMKKFKIQNDTALAKELYQTGNGDVAHAQHIHGAMGRGGAPRGLEGRARMDRFA